MGGGGVGGWRGRVGSLRQAKPSRLFGLAMSPRSASLVSCGQPLFLRRGIIACSISSPHEKGLVRFTGLTGTDTSRSVNR